MNFAYWLLPASLFVVLVVLILGLVNMMRGGPAKRSQQLMRYRILAQAGAVVVLMSALYFYGAPG
jgi:hypothetical protein